MLYIKGDAIHYVNKFCQLTDKHLHGIFLPQHGDPQPIYHFEVTQLRTFTGYIFDFCPLCGKSLRGESNER